MKFHVNTQKYDAKFVRLLSLLAVGMVNLVQANIHAEVKKFIRDIFEIRAGNNLIRFLQFDKIIDDYIKVLNAKAKTNTKNYSQIIWSKFPIEYIVTCTFHFN